MRMVGNIERMVVTMGGREARVQGVRRRGRLVLQNVDGNQQSGNRGRGPAYETDHQCQ